MMSDLSAASDVLPFRRRVTKVCAQRFIPTKALTKQAVEEKMQFLRSLNHRNLVSIEEIILHEDSDMIELSLEFMPLSVVELCVRVFPYHDEFSLAAILGQAIEGLLYLDSAGLCHTSFTESQVLADFAGNVKISGPDWCEKGKTLPLQLLPLTQHLMYPWLYSERVRSDATKWARGTHAVEFWQTVSRPTTSLNALKKSALLQLPWKKLDVRELMLLAVDHVRTEKKMKRAIGMDRLSSDARASM
ncbi:hypothetical protein HC256_005550 [Beauveria bassiana]|nr:hypothetical protein HC256_005550 [Beauveria bassiana]